MIKEYCLQTEIINNNENTIKLIKTNNNSREWGFNISEDNNKFVLEIPITKEKNSKLFKISLVNVDLNDFDLVLNILNVINRTLKDNIDLDELVIEEYHSLMFYLISKGFNNNNII